MANYIGIDIGGTTIKYGLLTAGGTFLHKGSIPTEVVEKGVPQFLEKLVEIIKGYQRGRDEAVQELKKAPTDLEVIGWAEPIKGVGLATAGIVNPETGKILFEPRSFPGYEGTQLKKLIEERCLFPCAVENDVNAAALGEFWLGAGRGAKSLFCITVKSPGFILFTISLLGLSSKYFFHPSSCLSCSSTLSLYPNSKSPFLAVVFIP